nr:MAG TPA: hypothetical protein [Inoviridae sp.]
MRWIGLSRPLLLFKKWRKQYYETLQIGFLPFSCTMFDFLCNSSSNSYSYRYLLL